MRVQPGAIPFIPELWIVLFARIMRHATTKRITDFRGDFKADSYRSENEFENDVTVGWYLHDVSMH